MNKNYINNGIVAIILCVLSYYISDTISRFVYHDAEVLIIVNNEGGKSVKITGYVYQNNGSKIIFDEIGDGCFVSHQINIPSVKFNQLKINYDKYKNDISSAFIDGNELPKSLLLKISKDNEIIKKGSYIIRQQNNDRITSKNILTFGLSLLIGSIFLTCFYVIKTSKNDGSNKKSISFLMYSTSALQELKLIDLLVIPLTLCVTFYVVVGCDAIRFLGALELDKNLDIYQYQVNFRAATGDAFPPFPYHPLSVFIFSSIKECFELIGIKNLKIADFPFEEIFFFKFTNIFFMMLTTLSIISFLIDKKYLNKGHARVLYYLSIFNPVAFYLGILYIQIDFISVYFLTLGTLFMADIKYNTRLSVLSATLLGLSLSIKMQQLLYIPPILVSFVFSMLHIPSLRNKFAALSYFVFVFILMLSIFTFIPMLNNSPYNVLIKNFEQAQRIYFTTIQYAPGLFLLLTIAISVITCLLFWFDYSCQCRPEEITLRSLLLLSSLPLAYSSSMIFTPSFLMFSFMGIIVYLGLVKDNSNRIFVSILSVLIVFSYMFSLEGDITKLLTFNESSSVFAHWFSKIPPPDKARLQSLIFTISASAMLGFSILFYKVSYKIKKTDTVPSLINNE